MEESALPVVGLGGIKPTDDGKNALLKLKIGAEDVVFAFPEILLRPLLNLVCDGIARTSRQQGREERAAFLVKWWEIGDTADGRLAVSFRLENNAMLTFALDRGQISQMREALEVLEGKAPTELPPGTRPN
jgi:hypothetical protein